MAELRAIAGTTLVAIVGAVMATAFHWVPVLEAVMR